LGGEKGEKKGSATWLAVAEGKKKREGNFLFTLPRRKREGWTEKRECPCSYRGKKRKGGGNWSTRHADLFRGKGEGKRVRVSRRGEGKEGILGHFILGEGERGGAASSMLLTDEKKRKKKENLTRGEGGKKKPSPLIMLGKGGGGKSINPPLNPRERGGKEGE